MTIVVQNKPRVPAVKDVVEKESGAQKSVALSRNNHDDYPAKVDASRI